MCNKIIIKSAPIRLFFSSSIYTCIGCIICGHKAVKSKHKSGRKEPCADLYKNIY